MGKKNKNFEAPFKKNDILEMEISGMSSEGNGIGKPMGFAVFVPLSDIGDIIRVRIVKVLKNFAFGKIEEIIVPSSRRIENDCSCYSKCGGCCYRHISYEAELEIKASRVKDAINRIGGFDDIKINPIIPSPNTDNYRNKCLLPVGTDNNGKAILGFYALNSHRIVQIDSCRLQPAAFDRIIAAFKAFIDNNHVSVYDEQLHKGIIRRLYLRIAETTGKIMAAVVINNDTLPCSQDLISRLISAEPDITSIVLNINKDKTNVALGKSSKTIYGDDIITDTLCGLTFDISPTSFYQVNRTQAEKLYNIAAKYANLTPEETLLDLYCGTGTIGLSIVKNGGKLIGAEIVQAAIDNANKNAEKNGITNAEFICADAAQAAMRLNHKGIHPDVIVIDPPRKGCDREVIDTISELSPKRVVYVSCDPATLARDLKIFTELGFIPTEITPVDMFPRTSHVECVVLLQKIDT